MTGMKKVLISGTTISQISKDDIVKHERAYDRIKNYLAGCKWCYKYIDFNNLYAILEGRNSIQFSCNDEECIKHTSVWFENNSNEIRLLEEMKYSVRMLKGKHVLFTDKVIDVMTEDKSLYYYTVHSVLNNIVIVSSSSKYKQPIFIIGTLISKHKLDISCSKFTLIPPDVVYKDSGVYMTLEAYKNSDMKKL